MSRNGDKNYSSTHIRKQCALQTACILHSKTALADVAWFDEGLKDMGVIRISEQFSIYINKIARVSVCLSVTPRKTF